MKSEIKISMTLELTEEEAIWLRDFVQNSPLPSDQEESTYDYEMRKKFFNAAKDVQHRGAVCKI